MTDRNQILTVLATYVLVFTLLFLNAIFKGGHTTEWRSTIELPATEVVVSGDGQVHPMWFSDEDYYYATESVFFEAANQAPECQALIINVILTRKADTRWNNTVKSVIWQHKQFSYTHDGKHEIMYDLDARKRIEAVVSKTLGGESVDLSEGATLYFNPDLASPTWDFSKLELVTKCGDHLFFKDRDTKGDF